jgi:Pin2-interacting protein X1
LKDDNLGLGAQRHGPVEKQRTGLDALQGLLGRLNGKTDTELEKEKKKLEEQQSAGYLQSRWNLIHFVRGGLLVQEKITLPSHASTRPLQGTDDGGQETRDIVVEDELGEDPPFCGARSDSEAKKSSKRKRRRDKREKEQPLIVENPVPENIADGQTAPLLGSPSSKTTEKPKGKDDKKKRHRTTEDDGRGEDEQAQVKLDEGSAAVKKRVSVSPSSLSNPTSISQPLHVEGRHAIRNRHIIQKKMAMMDSKALDEVNICLIP